MCRKQAVDRQRVWLRLLIKEHPPSFCLFFSLVTSLKPAWTGELSFFFFFFCMCARRGILAHRAGGPSPPTTWKKLFLFTEGSCVSWSLCGNPLLSSRRRGKKTHFPLYLKMSKLTTWMFMIGYCRGRKENNFCQHMSVTSEKAWNIVKLCHVAKEMQLKCFVSRCGFS